MTKKDIKTIAVGTAIGSGLFAFFWFVVRVRFRTRALPEIAPAQIKWEAQG